LFYTKSRDDRSIMQNSRVTMEVEFMQFSTSKDQNLVVGSMHYYGVIVEIWEVNYTKFTVPVFKCKWVDNKTDVKVDESRMTLVDFWKIYHDEPFIMAYQASQVFYIQDPTSKHWFVVLHGKKQHNNAEDTNNDICEIESLTRTMINKEYEDVVGVVHATRNDHDERIYICMCMCFTFSFTIYNFYYISYSWCLSYLFDNLKMADDKVSRSRTGRGPTRLKNMFKKKNDGKKNH